MKVKHRFITIRRAAPDNQAMLDNQTMAARIKAAIEGAGHTQVSIAHAFKITEQAVSGWIRTGKVDKRKLPKLAQLTGRPLSFFMPDADGDPASQPMSYDKVKMELAAELVLDQFDRWDIQFRPRQDADLITGVYEVLMSATANNVVDATRWLSDQVATRGLGNVGQGKARSNRSNDRGADAATTGSKPKASRRRA